MVLWAPGHFLSILVLTIPQGHPGSAFKAYFGWAGELHGNAALMVNLVSRTRNLIPKGRYGVAGRMDFADIIVPFAVGHSMR